MLRKNDILDLVLNLAEQLINCKPENIYCDSVVWLVLTPLSAMSAAYIHGVIILMSDYK